MNKNLVPAEVRGYKFWLSECVTVAGVQWFSGSVVR